MKIKIWIKWLVLLISIVFIGACGNSGSDDPLADNDAGDGTGYLALSMVDAPGGTYQAVYVSIKEVQVCIAPDACDGSGDCAENCEWETIATVEETFNLLELVNGVMATLGLTELETGQYNQMRLILSNVADDGTNILGGVHEYPQYIIDEAGDVHEMKVPSGYQSGIKLVHPFQIVAGLTTELILDFDVSRSVVKAGNSGKYNLKPTIKVIGTYSRAIVTGRVYADGDPLVPLEGATVTAWHETAEDVWSAAMTTSTDPEGGYMLYLEPNTYKIVVSAVGYEPACFPLTVILDEISPDNDVTLAMTPMVMVTSTISGTAAPEDPDADPLVYPEYAPTVTISFSKQIGGCLLEPVDAVVFTQSASEAFYNTTDGFFTLAFGEEVAAGTYDITLSWDEVTLVLEDVVIQGPGPVELVFP